MPRVEHFDAEFVDDIIFATAYYDAIALQLGDRFRESLRLTLASVRKRPESFGFTRRPSRGAMLSKFPYVVIFRATDTTLLFGGVFHVASDPKRWAERMTDLKNG